MFGYIAVDIALHMYIHYVSLFWLFWELAAKAQDCFRPSSGSGGQAELVLNSSS